MAIPEDRPEVAALVQEISIPVVLVAKVGLWQLRSRLSVFSARPLRRHACAPQGLEPLPTAPLCHGQASPVCGSCMLLLQPHRARHRALMKADLTCTSVGCRHTDRACAAGAGGLGSLRPSSPTLCPVLPYCRALATASSLLCRHPALPSPRWWWSSTGGRASPTQTPGMVPPPCPAVLLLAFRSQAKPGVTPSAIMRLFCSVLFIAAIL